MSELQGRVQKEYEEWESTPPNVVTRGLGKLTAPISHHLNSVMKKIVSPLEGVVRKTNEFIADAVKHFSGEMPNFENMDEKSFEEWFSKADKSANDWKTGGIAFITSEGAITGVGGIETLLIDIPAVFLLILSFSNKIALTYGFPINTLDAQMDILNAIYAGSANNLEEKVAAISVIKQTKMTLKLPWKMIDRIAADEVTGKLETIATAKMIVAIREFLTKFGITITKRKAGQIVPIIGAISGMAINYAWASDAMEAVRQNSRKWIIDTYYS